jgi:hypothetical protein
MPGIGNHAVIGKLKTKRQRANAFLAMQWLNDLNS